jgi:hypothetical protein
VYITAISPGEWDCWREDWLIVWADAHDHLVQSTGVPIGNRDHWEEIQRLQVAFVPTIERIRYLASHGLSSMMVLFDFLSRCIALLHLSIHSAW